MEELNATKKSKAVMWWRSIKGRFGLGRDFLMVWAGQTVSVFGDTVGGMALNIYILQTTGSATVMSFNMFLNLAPRLVAGPIAGVVLDRTSRKKVMVLCDVVQGIATGIVTLLLFSHSLKLNHIYLWTLAQSIVRMFYEPATFAIIPSLVDKDSVQQANAMQSTGRSIGQVFGPAAAGVTFALLGPWVAMLADAATFFISATCIGLAKPKVGEAGVTGGQTQGRPKAGIGDFVEGLRFFGHSKLALYLLIMTMLINMAMIPSGISLQYHLINTLKAPPEIYGLTWSVSAAATLFSSLVLVSRKRWKKQSMMLVLGSLGMGGAMLFAAPMRSPLVIPVVWSLYGLGSPLLGVAVSTLYQEITPSDLRGRVFSVRVTLATALAPLSSLIIGPLLDSVGSVVTLLALGGTLSFTALWVLATKEFRIRDQ